MKKHLFLKSLLIAIGLLITSINTAWAWDKHIYTGNVFYFKPSEVWKSDNARFAVAFGHDNDTYYWYSCQPVEGETDLYYVVSNGDYQWMIFCRMKNGSDAERENKWDNRWNESQRVEPNSNYNRFDLKANWATDFDWYKYAPPISSVTIAKGSMTTYGGTGTTAEDPILVAKGGTIEVTVTDATSTVAGGYTKYYQFYKKEGAGSSSAWESKTNDVTTRSFKASSSADVTYEIKVDVENEYYSSYSTSPTSSNTLYFKTINPVYAILGTFNNWKHSAATWDMTNTSSTYWDAEFTLDAGSYEFQVVYDNSYYGLNTGGTYTTISRGSNSASGLATSKNNLKLTADYTGTYGFRFNSSGNVVTVTYPTIYQVNYSVVTKNAGTGGGAASTSPTVSSGGYVVDGTSVTFTAASANAGYTWRGWFSKNNPSNWSDGKLSEGTSLSYTRSITGNTTIYAIYSENDYTVTVGATTGGSITTPAAPTTTVTAHPGTATSIAAALDNLAWRFKGWVKTVGSGNVTFGSASSLSTNVKTTSDATIQAQFEPRYGLVGSRNGDGDANQGMPGWTNGSAADFTVEDFDAVDKADGVDLECTRTLLPNRQYKFMVYDRVANTRRGCTSENNNNNAQVLPAGSNWELNGTYQVLINTVGYGDYTFHITKMGASSTYYPSLQVDRPTSYQLTLGSKTTYLTDVDASSATEGGTVAAQTTESGENFTITNGQYVAKDGTITFTATPTKGYEVEWYKDTYSNKYNPSGTIYGVCSYSITNSGNTLTLSNIKDDVKVYAKFVEKKCRVNVYTTYNSLGSVSINGTPTSWSLATVDVGVHTTATVAVTPETNYYVDSLCKAYGAENFEYTAYSETSSNTSATIRGTGEGSSANIRARINELDRIYFYNYNYDTRDALWSTGHVYVYFNIYWGKYSSAYDGVVTHYCTQYAEMSPVWSGSKYYWAYVPRAFMLETGDNKTHVAFSDVDMHTYDVFSGNHGAYRSDYNRILNMFVPNHTESVYSNSTSYNSNGYWKQYNPTGGEGAGYYLQLHTGDDGNGNGTYSQQGEFKAESNSIDSKLAFTMRVDNLGTQTQYRIVSAGGISYYVSSTITNAACTDITVYEYENCKNCYFTVNLTAEGDYKFILDQSGEDMKLSVEYPVGQGDYRLKHTYTDGSAKTTYSDIIKARDAAGGQTVSMYLNDGGTETLVLQRCTGINVTTKKPEWSEGFSDNLSDVLTELGKSGNGVYQFDVKINTSTHKLSEPASNIGLYKGNYYIKTDCAYGMWADYHSNVMGKNTETFSTEKPETFDYYYCTFTTGGTNVKCVVANAYNNALCDTLLGDAVIGMDKQALPDGKSANIRFSYNSYTNEVKRTYMNGSAYSGDEYLLLQGDEKIADTNGNPFTDNKVTFVDHEDWIYIIDVKAKETARARLTANYNSNLQYLIGSAPTKVPGDEGYDEDWIASTEELLGGTTENTDWNPIRIIYDFKTNHLISAWVATADIVVGADQTKAINADLMLIRENQEPAHQITFANSNSKLSEVKTVYGVLKLTKDHVQNTSGTLSSSEREFYWISFPFDVDLSQSFGGLGYYGIDWAMEYYDGKTRAKYGYWADSEVNWKIMWDKDTILHAYEGYVLALELGNFQSSYMWPNGSTEIFQYFPSINPVSTITETTINVEFPDQEKYYCSINRGDGTDGDRRIKDSYWHCIGVPGYANYELTVNEWDDVNKEAITYNPSLEIPYVYEWRPTTNDYEVVKTSTFTFKPMTSYLVQFSKNAMTWTNASATPSSIVARRRAKSEIRECEFRLALLQNEQELDRTFIQMSDDENITTGFEFNYDLSKAMNANKANLYTLIGYEQVAGNVMPFDEQTTIVPVGVKIATDGEYTFAMSEGTHGVGAVLVDKVANTRTNLALTEYTVNLTAGTCNDRFELELSPIAQMPTDLENGADGENDKHIRKVVVDGVLYIVKDGKVFDARGNRVQ